MLIRLQHRPEAQDAVMRVKLGKAIEVDNEKGPKSLYKLIFHQKYGFAMTVATNVLHMKPYFLITFREFHTNRGMSAVKCAYHKTCTMKQPRNSQWILL